MKIKDVFILWLKDLYSENISYKLVSLFIALILWLTILGRRDFVISKEVDIEIATGQGLSLASQSVDKIKVKVSGPRGALKKFVDSGLSQMVTVNAASKSEGEYELEIPTYKIDVPFGVKVIQVRPSTVKVQIKKNN